MKLVVLQALSFVAVVFAAAPGFSVHIEGVRYAKPPARPTVYSWPDGLAAVIADPTYRDGYNYRNPGYAIEYVDTFFYGGDTAALNRFMEKIAKIKGVHVSVAFSKSAGTIDRNLRAHSVGVQEMLGVPASSLDGPSCTWLVSVTPTVETDIQVVIFLGSKELQVEKLQLPSWKP